MRIIKHQRLLHFLVIFLELVKVRPIAGHFILERVQRLNMVLECPLLQAKRSNLVKPCLQPLPDGVSLGSKLLSETFVVLLPNHLSLQDCVALRHQLAYLAPLLCQLLTNVHMSNVFLSLQFTYYYHPPLSGLPRKLPIKFPDFSRLNYVHEPHNIISLNTNM